MKSFLLAFLATTIATSLTGCGASESLGTVRGNVTSDGQPVAEATISFRNTETGESASAQLDASGAYQITGAGGVDPGTYKVIILPPEVEVSLGPNSPPTTRQKEMPNLPKRYRSIQTTPLSAEVGNGENEINFELTEK